MRQPSLFSPIKQSRFEKPAGPYVTFQTTSQFNKGQLVDFRKEVRNNVTSREPFNTQSDKAGNLFTSWKKSERKLTDTSTVSKLFTAKTSSPKKGGRIPGGLNIDEIFSGGKKTQEPLQNSNSYYYPKSMKVDQYFKKQHNNSFGTLNPTTHITSGPRGSRNYHDSPQKAQLKLERYKSWDSKLDVQLKLQNTSISKRISPSNNNIRSYQQYGGLKDDYKEFNLQSGLDAGRRNSLKFIGRSNTPPLVAKYTEKFSLTDIVRMSQHFSSLNSSEISQISRGYIQELNNLQLALARLVKSTSTF